MNHTTRESTREGSNELAIRDIGPVEEDLLKVENAIKGILTNLNGHAYASFIRSINTAEGLTREKNMSEGLMTIRVLQEILKIWKAFIGSEICTMLQEKLKKDAQEYKSDYGMTDLEIKDNNDNTELCTLRRTGKLMETHKINLDTEKKIVDGVEADTAINTKGGVEFDPKNKIKTIPGSNESTKIVDAIELLGKLDREKKTMATQNALIILGQFNVQWPGDAKGTIPQLFMVIELMNLMFLKIELLGAKVMIDAFGVLGLNIDGIIDRR